MKKFILLLLISLSFVGLSLNVSAEKIDRTIDAQADGVVLIHNVRGKIDIRGWEKNAVRMNGTIDDLAEKVIFNNDGKTTTIKIKLPRNSGYHNRKGSKLEINVPVNSKVVFSGVATDLDIQSVMGGLDIKSVSGDIDIAKVSQRVYVNSVSGDLNFAEMQGSLEVSTVSGDVGVDCNCEKIHLSAVSADLNVKLEMIESAVLSNVSGDIRVSGQLVEDGELRLSSVSGDGVFIIKDDLNARVSMQTAPGGKIINEISDDKPVSSFIKSQNLRFTSGNGNGVVRMSTVSGDIGLKKADDSEEK